MLRLGKLPEGVANAQLFGVAILGGIGSTMSLFIGSLAFNAAKVSVSRWCRGSWGPLPFDGVEADEAGDDSGKLKRYRSVVLMRETGAPQRQTKRVGMKRTSSFSPSVWHASSSMMKPLERASGVIMPGANFSQTLKWVPS